MKQILCNMGNIISTEILVYNLCKAIKIISDYKFVENTDRNSA